MVIIYRKVKFAKTGSAGQRDTDKRRFASFLHYQHRAKKIFSRSVLFGTNIQADMAKPNFPLAEEWHVLYVI